MPDPFTNNSDPSSGEELRREIKAQTERKLQARRETERSIWFGLGMFGMIGWSVAIPTLIGVGVGWWLDQKSNSRYSWTLMCLVLGLALGCLMAWQWVQRESQQDHSNERNSKMDDMTWAFGIVSWAGGVLLGLFYFGSLWWVVRRLPAMTRPGLWIPLSTFVRTIVVLVGVFFLAGHDWKRLVAVMVGFLTGRVVVFWQVGALRQGSSLK